MKKFLTIWIGVFLLCSAQARAITCPAGQYVSGNSCVDCAAGKWSAGGTVRYCSSCSNIHVDNNTKCTGCSKDGKCTAGQCAGDYMWNGSKCVRRVCSAGQYVYVKSYSFSDDPSSCVACPDGKWSQWSADGKTTGCLPCSAITGIHGMCTACTASGVCTAASCASGYGWSGSANACVPLTCSAGQIFGAGSCVDCKPGTYSKALGTYKEDNYFPACLACSSIAVENGICTDCLKDGSACTAATCNSGYMWNGSACVKLECPAGQYLKGTSCVNCPSDSWSAGGTATACQPCSSISVGNGTCVSCSAEGGCTTPLCSLKYAFTKKAGCVPQICFSNTYEDDSGNCRPCSDIAVNGGVCSACSYDGTACEKAECNEGWTNDTAASCTPTKECSAGGFWDEETQSCKGCDAYTVANGECSECNAAACTKAECDKANMTFSEADQKCGVECAANQYLDASFTCKACPSGQYSEGGRSAEATSCSSCSSFKVSGGTCVECSNDSCLKAVCSDGYRLDETGEKCVENAARCTDGLFVTSDGCCCTK